MNYCYLGFWRYYFCFLNLVRDGNKFIIFIRRKVVYNLFKYIFYKYFIYLREIVDVLNSIFMNLDICEGEISLFL